MPGALQRRRLLASMQEFGDGPIIHPALVEAQITTFSYPKSGPGYY
jgi:hypothetical protein